MIPRSCLLFLCLFVGSGWAQTRLDIPALIKLLLAQGYHDIREVEREGDKFEVEALDAREQKVELRIDAHSGKIIEKKEAD